ncbi:FKBP-type peptidyl-prolyl cis-trans isomerase FklB [Spirosomataceae bacterium TFI 002]|nr:FKBP-type peptidyl-prolyl cis-trans isomerase FklB [Spirosomataceae bacterium TFI 002]
MNKVFKYSAAFLFLFITKSSFAQLNNAIDSLSYSIGINIGENISNQGLEPNIEILSKAISDILSKQPLLIQSQECNAYIQSYFQKEFARKAEAGKKVGEDFLAQNATKEGVKTTASGLQYLVLTEGTGAKPVSTDKVKVHYHGTTIDGKVFDSSVNRGTPSEFGVTQVIQGWVEALQLMPTGSKWRLFIPSGLAYGPQGSRGIGPNEVLIFEVELIEIVKEG